VRTQTDTVAEKRRKVLEILEDDLIALGHEISPATFHLPSAPVHDEICKLLLNYTIKQLCLILPRGIAKTTLATIFVIHHIFFGDRGRKVVVIVSKTQAHAKSILSTIKNILEFSAGFKRLFGYHGEQVSKIWREDRIVLDTGDAIIARGTGQPIRGINENLQRPTLILVDDPEDENNTKTVEAMKANLDWTLQAVVPSMDSHRGRVIVIGTPLHEKCIVMSLSEMRDFKTIMYGNDTEAGVALWEESKSIEWLRNKKAALKDVGKVRMFYQEYECKLIPGEDALFRKEDIEYLHDDAEIKIEGDDHYLHIPENEVMIPVNVFMGIDPASSVTQTADYSTIVVIAVTAQLEIYVVDYYRKRVKPMQLVETHSFEQCLAGRDEVLLGRFVDSVVGR